MTGTIRGGATLLALLLLGYLVVPGHARAAAPGVPLGAHGTMWASAVAIIAIVYRHARTSRRALIWGGAAIVVLAILKIAVGALAGPVGWTARYYANEDGVGAHQWSSEFPRLDATRIDRAISFENDRVPAYYLNDAEFARGSAREIGEPMSVRWNGQVFNEVSRSARASLAARGTAAMIVDGLTVLTVDSKDGPHREEGQLMLAPGEHEIEVRYLKPPNVPVSIAASVIASPGDSPLVVTPAGAARARVGQTGWLRGAAEAITLAALGVWLAIFWLGERGSSRDGRAVRIVALTSTAVFFFQGWLQARHFIGHVVSLTGGDDWFAFEAMSRDVLRHGPLMTFGKALGQGLPFAYYPLYSYFLAVAHGLGGEDFFAPVFVQFLVLAAVTTVVYRMMVSLAGPRPALAAVVALGVIFELDFVRYYTVTFLSENLYILTVTMTLAALVRLAQDGRDRDVLLAGFWGGVSTITRPAMLLFFVPALGFVALAVAVRTGEGLRAGRAVALMALLWAAVIVPVTLRNQIVSGRPVLISDGLPGTFIVYNVPLESQAARYRAMFTGSMTSAAAILARIAWEHPIGLLRVQATKMGFSLGMVHWISAYRPHPELVFVTLAYVAALFFCPLARSLAALPIHLFVLAHLAGMALTQPWSYGYRLILPPFVYTSALGAAAWSSRISRPRGAHSAEHAAFGDPA